MDKKTFLAVALSVIVITVGFVIQGVLFPAKPSIATQSTALVNDSSTSGAVTPTGNKNAEPGPVSSGEAALFVSSGGIEAVQEIEPLSERTYTITTDLYSVTFTNKGGDVTSIKLLKHFEGNKNVEMLFSGTDPARAFSIFWGADTKTAIDNLFYKRTINDYTIEFYRNFTIKNPDGSSSPSYTLTKRYEFKPDEYAFDITVKLQNSANEYIPLNFNGSAYTIGFGPQIGPKFGKLMQNAEFRKYYTYYNEKRNDEKKVPANGKYTLPNRVTWASIVGKYFALIGVPDATEYSISYSTETVPGLPATSSLYFTRPVIKSSNVTDKFMFYIGPKTASILSAYNKAEDNAFKVSNYHFDLIVDTSPILGWLEAILKFSLKILYGLIPNYGVGIILLTLIVKVVFFPLTKKSSESTFKMQKLAPKIKELQAKYKDNKEKLNKEMAEMYKKAGANPLSGCLPMLLQIPIFFAMYNLFNNSFDLRGANFISGWISDLSSPESVWNFSPFTLPIVGWSNLRLLPFIYLFSQLFSGKLTQTPDSGSNSSMKLMMYAMPAVFFFILYEVPSGLLIYWIVSNVLQMFQQMYINRLVRRKDA